MICLAGKAKAKTDVTEDKPVKEVSKKDKIAAAMGAINTKFGKKTIGTLTQMADDFKIEFIETESAMVNKMLYGGWVIGKISEIYGPPDSGKTSNALSTIGWNMKKDPNFTAGWFETEGHFDVKYATETFGIDPERFTIWSMQDYGAENGLDILEGLLRSGAFNFIAVNTVAGLTPRKELDGSMSDEHMALQARMMSRLMRKIVAIASVKRTHVQFINQVRSTMGMGNDVPAGGKALAFWARQRMFMKAGFIEKDDAQKGYDPDIFKKIESAVKKNTCATLNPYRKCTYFVEYGVGIDTVGELPQLAASAGIIVLRGAWHYEYEPGTEKPIVLPNGDFARWQGAGAFRNYLRSHPEYAASIRARVSGDIFEIKSMTEDEIKEAKAEEDLLTADLKDEDPNIDVAEVG